METLDLEQLEQHASAIDCAVDATPGADPFCSRSFWTLPYHRAFGMHREIEAYRDGGAYVLLAASRHPRLGRVLEPLEAMWGFASTVLGSGAAYVLAEGLQRVRLAGRVLLTGVPLDGPVRHELVRALEPFFETLLVGSTPRYVASLADGLEGWQARRSVAFRRNLRAGARRRELAEIRYERIRPELDQLDAVYARILAIERRSWKAAAGNGVDRGPMADFYRDMWPRLARAGALLVVIARRGERDLGYVHGGLVGRRFRGLQVSFDQAVRALSLGNGLQYEMIRWLCEQGIELYDLGGQSAYKARWGERRDVTATLLVRPR